MEVLEWVISLFYFFATTGILQIFHHLVLVLTQQAMSGLESIFLSVIRHRRTACQNGCHFLFAHLRVGGNLLQEALNSVQILDNKLIHWEHEGFLGTELHTIGQILNGLGDENQTTPFREGWRGVNKFVSFRSNHSRAKETQKDKPTNKSVGIFALGESLLNLLEKVGINLTEFEGAIFNRLSDRVEIGLGGLFQRFPIFIKVLAFFQLRWVNLVRTHVRKSLLGKLPNGAF
mmetsp:Transcript_30413/g.47219  ORF Transcript_30413/g.47219 Transcript_30413/m.47219 type:complete len:232 (-) Transcript_30413:3378-4073(-)